MTPLFSVLTPVYHPEPEHLEAAIGSVVAQTNGDWEHILVLDGPQPAAVMDVVARHESDRRVRVVRRAENGGISAASASGLEVAQGTFVVLLDHDDLLAPFALGACAAEIERWPDVDVIYSDFDFLDWDGRRDNAFCKPAFSPERLRSHNYVAHLDVYRRSLVEAVGGFRPGFDGAQDHDLALRTTEQARRVVHIPRVLYHWRRTATSTSAVPETKDWAYDAGVRAVQSHIDRIGMPAVATRHPEYLGIVTIDPVLTVHPKVSIVIPTGGRSRVVMGEEFLLVDRCIGSVLATTTYPDFEIVVVVDDRARQSVAYQLEHLSDDRIRVVRNPRPFNFAEACNLGRDHATGDILVFLNDDTEVVTPNWIERLVLFADLDGVGVVGVKLVYSDGLLQHIGLVARGGTIGHRHMGEPGDELGNFTSFVVQSNLLAVTGACIAVRADRFDEVGGFAAIFPLAFNDVDLCLKLYRSGYRTVLDPQTVLVHHESSSRDPSVSTDEIEAINARWRDLLHDDPYDNPAMRTYGYTQIQPPAFLLELRERVDGAVHPGRAWPP